MTSPVPLTTRRVRGVGIGTETTVVVLVVGVSTGEMVVVVAGGSVVIGANVVVGVPVAAWDGAHADTRSRSAPIPSAVLSCMNAP